MLNFNQIKTGKVIIINEQPSVIIKTDHHKMGRGGAVLKTRCRNLIDSSIIDKTFQGAEKAEEASTETKKANFLYKDENEAHFMDNETYEQFSLDLENIGDKLKFLKDDIEVDILYFNEKPVALDLPIKMKFTVTNSPPGIKGNSAGNVNKTIEIETGAKISFPMFIKEGDVVIVNTETGEYAERAK
jgi:elongation factor P